jgi:hypothetical protein
MYKIYHRFIINVIRKCVCEKKAVILQTFVRSKYNWTRISNVPNKNITQA